MPKKSRSLADRLWHLGPCDEAVVWLRGQKVPQVAWDACERGDWMLWLLGKLSGPPESEERKKLVLTSCGCARLVVHLAKSLKVLECIEVAEMWAARKATLEELKEARSAAADAADAAYNAASTAAAADAAAYAAYAAASTAATAATAAAAAAAATATAATATAARKETLKKCADVVRQFYPKAPKVKGV